MPLLSNYMLVEGGGDLMVVLPLGSLPGRTPLSQLRWRLDREQMCALVGGPAGPEVSIPMSQSALATDADLREQICAQPLLLQIGLGAPAPIEVPPAGSEWAQA